MTKKLGAFWVHIFKYKSLFRIFGLTFLFWTGLVPAAFASELDLSIPDLSKTRFFSNAIDGRTLLMYAIGLGIFGIFFGLFAFIRVKKMPVHRAMREISDLIFATCKTYLLTQGKFILLLELLVAAIIALYFGYFRGEASSTVLLILAFSLLGILGSYSVAWFGIRINNFANSRTAFASLAGRAFPVHATPLRSGMSIGMLLISLELLILLAILLWVPGKYAGACFLGFAIGESLAASALRIAGGIFTKIADIGSDLMKIVFNIKEDDARNPGVIADCAGDNAGDSIGPTADGFETYGVTAVALIMFILLGVRPDLQATLLVWLFSMSALMVVSSGLSYLLNQIGSRLLYQKSETMDFEAPLTSLVWVNAIFSIGLTFLASYFLIPNLNGDPGAWWKLSSIMGCGTLAGALIPELIKVFTSTNSGHVQEIVQASKEGGASLNVLAGLTAGNFSAYWVGLLFIVLMGTAYGISQQGLGQWMQAEAVFAFGLVAFGFLSMAPVTLAVDSYGPVTDNAQSVYELSGIENIPDIEQEIEKNHGFKVRFDRAKDLLEENDSAGNTFKATSKPVLIGTAVVGAMTMIFSIIFVLTKQLTETSGISLLNPFLLLGFIAGGAIIYWFSGATLQAVSTGAYRAVEFIKANIKLEGSEKASVEDSKRVVQICTQYSQKGMLNIFMVVFFAALAFACVDPYFFIGYLVSLALFGLFQALFMANAGGAWDNAKKIVEVELKQKGSALHAATVVGDTVGDPFKDTSSVSMNPVIKFTSLFGLLAVELAAGLSLNQRIVSAVILSMISIAFVWRSFYGMRIERS